MVFFWGPSSTAGQIRCQAPPSSPPGRISPFRNDMHNPRPEPSWTRWSGSAGPFFNGSNEHMGWPYGMKMGRSPEKCEDDMTSIGEPLRHFHMWISWTWTTVWKRSLATTSCYQCYYSMLVDLKRLVLVVVAVPSSRKFTHAQVWHVLTTVGRSSRNGISEMKPNIGQNMASKPRINSRGAFHRTSFRGWFAVNPTTQMKRWLMLVKPLFLCFVCLEVLWIPTLLVASAGLFTMDYPSLHWWSMHLNSLISSKKKLSFFMFLGFQTSKLTKTPNIKTSQPFHIILS